jgi:hypothetical protein
MCSGILGAARTGDEVSPLVTPSVSAGWVVGRRSLPHSDRFGEISVDAVAKRPTQAVETRNGDFRWR